MGKTFKFDPDEDFGGGLSKADRKRLKQERKDRRKKEAALNSHMEETDDRTASQRIADDVADGGWDKF